MKTAPDWNGQRYYPISRFYRKRFGERVHKITVNVAKTCPNRRKSGGTGCIFCDEWGSAGDRSMMDLPLPNQIRINREKIAARFNVEKFLVYFQPFSNTYTELTRLEENIETALSQDRICGVVIGTRPDCLPDEIFPLLGEFHERSFVSIELGVQSFSNQRLEFLKRGHSAEQSIQAIEKLHRFSGVDVGIHLIFGLPGEMDREIIEAAGTVSALPVDNVKLHNLHVLVNTPLEVLYRKNLFEPEELEEYTRKVVLFLEHLSPEVAVQRLAAVASRRDDLVAPSWTAERSRPTQFIQKRLKDLNTYQGIHHEAVG
ncbi:MAG: TIGR01212 family radical SAM protein [Proteobacteria bacterium]|nr:TIGR01212 family radical SAM protein [Pseudomonadota bacterium]